MESTATSIADALADFAGGFVSLREIQKILAHELRSNPEGAGDIQKLLSNELRSRRLSLADHGELVAGIGAILAGEDIDAEVPSENVATEAAEETPDEPGIYRFDDEGTLVLADDMVDADDAYDGVDEPAQAPEIAVGSVLRDRFELREEVARGSMGVVYKAVDQLKKDSGANDPFVAIKLISPEFSNQRTALRSFQNEVANAQRLSHPNIVRLHELDRDGDYYFISMEWLDGEALDALLDRSRGSALQPTQTYAIIEQLCDALIYAHEHDVVHADVKPGNVFLINTGELKLIDFGIAQQAEEESGGTVALTPAYASCERLEHQPPTAQDDLFSLACMIYRLLAGRRVFGSMNALEAEKAGVVPVPIGGMSETRWAALSQALAFRRANRQDTVREFAEAFGRREEPRETAEHVPAAPPVEEDTPSAVSASDESHVSFVDTAALDAWPEEELNDDVGELLDQGDTTRIDALNETAELSALAGVSRPEEARPSEQPQPSESTASQTANPETGLSALEEAIVADLHTPQTGNAMDVDTARLQVPDDLKLAGDTTVVEEQPFVDTVSLANSGTVDIDLLNMGDAPAASEPEPEPPKPKVEPPKPKVEPPKPKAAPPKTAAKPKASSNPKPKPRKPAKAKAPSDAKHTEQLRRQLSGKATGRRSEPLYQRLMVGLREQPFVAAGAALAIIVTLGLAALLIGGNEVSPPEQPAQAVAAPVPKADVVAPTVQTAPVASPAKPTIAEAKPEPVDSPEPVVSPEPEPAVTKPDPAPAREAAQPAVDDFAPAVVVPLETTVSPDPLPLTNAVAVPEPGLPAAAATEDNGQSAAYIALAEEAYIAGDAANARIWLQRAEASGAGVDELAPILTLVKRLEKAGGSVQPVAPTQGPTMPTATEAAKANNPIGFPEYPLSAFEFVRYVEPRYPTSGVAGNDSGWVDVAFIIGKDGKPREIHVTGTNLSARFEGPSISAVRKWRFEPLTPDNGAPIAARTAVRLRFDN